VFSLFTYPFSMPLLSLRFLDASQALNSWLLRYHRRGL